MFNNTLQRPLSPAPHALPYTTGFQSLHLSQAVNHSARLMFSSCIFLIFIATENVHKMLLTSSLEESPEFHKHGLNFSTFQKHDRE